MTHGIGTNFLVVLEIRDHPFHRQDRHPLSRVFPRPGPSGRIRS